MDAQQKDDGFKWFGEGFDGFPKRLPEDCVEYAIYIIDEKLKAESVLRTRLKAFQNAANSLTKKLLKDYIWQREEFKLELLRSKDAQQALVGGSTAEGDQPVSPLAYTLQGRTNFGDSIADEWLIVFLLRELSASLPDAWIKVCDTDGEFLLIEAAAALPKWLNPDVASNRVWINNGQLKIIPLPSTKDATTVKGLEGSPTLTESLTYIATNSKSLLHSPSIETAALTRLSSYPAAISQTLHNALVTIPRRLAYILHTSPRTISPATDAFYLRDALSTKPLNTKDLATLTFSPEDFVTCPVRFTRVGYAQLLAQEFPAPPSWTAVLPHMAETKWAVGMKVACGFEILAQDRMYADSRAAREIALLLEDVESGDVALPTDAAIAGWEQTVDEEKWLDIDFKDFEKELSGKGTAAGSSTSDAAGTARVAPLERDVDVDEAEDPTAQQNLRKMVDRFETFLADDKAGLDGVDDDESGSDLDSSDADSDASSDVSSSGEDKDGSFDDAEFEAAMREMMGMPAADVEASGLLAEARKLALEMEDEVEGERDEEEETRIVMEMMERELKGHGALDLDQAAVKEQLIGKTKVGERGKFGKKKAGAGAGTGGGTGAAKGKAMVEDDIEELSSDDEDEGNDIDIGMLKNLLESLKTQGGMSGPAGNMLAAMGLKLPRDDGEDKET